MHDYVITPACGAPPFRLDEALPEVVGGKTVARFYDVFLTTYPFSFTGLPIVSLPSGTTAAGLPVGVQVRGVAPARGSGHRGGGRLCGTSSGPLPASRRRQEPG